MRWAYIVSLEFEGSEFRSTRTDITVIDTSIFRAIDRAREAVGDHSAHVTRVVRKAIKEQVNDSGRPTG